VGEGGHLDRGPGLERGQRYRRQIEHAVEIAASLDGHLDGQGAAKTDLRVEIIELLVGVERCFEFAAGEGERQVAVGHHLDVGPVDQDLVVDRQVPSHPESLVGDEG
jgi:hypothetical protein